MPSITLMVSITVAVGVLLVVGGSFYLGRVTRHDDVTTRRSMVTFYTQDGVWVEKYTINDDLYAVSGALPKAQRFKLEWARP